MGEHTLGNGERERERERQREMYELREASKDRKREYPKHGFLLLWSYYALSPSLKRPSNRSWIRNFPRFFLPANPLEVS
jgi:hypothetical protein